MNDLLRFFETSCFLLLLPLALLDDSVEAWRRLCAYHHLRSGLRRAP